jgi:hypothetical protein
MRIETCIKESFAVIGREGSTEDGAGFVQRLWADANSRFAEVAALAKKDEKVGLYRASLNKNDGKGFLNNACKAYIPVGGGQNAPALVMRFGRGQGTTEIELPTANGQQPTAVYDLQGRRVLNPTKGMYIINGKKVVIR